MQIKPLTKPRFDSLLYRKEPIANLIFEAREWWATDDETLIATAGIDLFDHDFSWVILGRDETGVFRCIENKTCFNSLLAARADLMPRITELSKDSAKEYPQGDNDRKKLEILTPCAPEADLHPVFRMLITDEAHSPARGLIKELSYAFTDLDGNYKKDFQTAGFAGRLWELYLYAAFYEMTFSIDDAHAVPDYIVEKGGVRFGVEAVTVNPSQKRPAPVPNNPHEERELCKNYMPIKWSGPLKAKLSKKYWELDHIKDCPLIIAIHDFHGNDSMVWSLPALSDYLYGVRCNNEGVDEQVGCCYRDNGAPEPMGFFNFPDADHISAVMASNEASLGKFNRMGKIAGFGDPRIVMERRGAQLDLAQMSCTPVRLLTEVGVVNETWSSGLRVFHNPKARHPVDPDFFPSSLHVFLNEGQRTYWSRCKTHILCSRTFVNACHVNS